MSRYHPSTHLTDRNLTPKGVLKLSSGDCRHLINSKGSKTKQQLLTRIDAAPYCKVTWGTTISRRLEHISEILNIYPRLMKKEEDTTRRCKMYAATPYEEAYATAISNKVHPVIKNAKVLLAFGGSCLHILSVNQDKENNLLPGSNSVSEGLSKDIQTELVTTNELIGTEKQWIDNHTPPLPPHGTFYTTFPLDSDLDYSTYILIARLFQELNELITKANGSYLICGAPTLINPTNDNGVGKWWSDKSPRVIQTSFDELAIHSALPQKQHDESNIFHGGLLSDRYKIQVGRSRSSSLIETTVHEMVLSAMAQPQLVIDKSISLLSDSTNNRLRGIDLAIQYFNVHDK